MGTAKIKNHLDSDVLWKKLKDKHDGVPELIFGGIKRFFRYHLEPGAGLNAILSNDLRTTVQYCRNDVLESLRQIMFLLNDLPSDCWGTQERVNDWISQR